MNRGEKVSVPECAHFWAERQTTDHTEDTENRLTRRTQGRASSLGHLRGASGQVEHWVGGRHPGSGLVNPSGDRQDREILHIRPVNPLILRGGIEIGE